MGGGLGGAAVGATTGGTFDPVWAQYDPENPQEVDWRKAATGALLGGAFGATTMGIVTPKTLSKLGTHDEAISALRQQLNSKATRDAEASARRADFRRMK